jgi:hypothetical protein
VRNNPIKREIPRNQRLAIAGIDADVLAHDMWDISQRYADPNQLFARSQPSRLCRLICRPWNSVSMSKPSASGPHGNWSPGTLWPPGDYVARWAEFSAV